jgi:hypothetical protein
MSYQIKPKRTMQHSRTSHLNLRRRHLHLPLLPRRKTSLDRDSDSTEPHNSPLRNLERPLPGPLVVDHLQYGSQKGTFGLSWTWASRGKRRFVHWKLQAGTWTLPLRCCSSFSLSGLHTAFLPFPCPAAPAVSFSLLCSGITWLVRTENLKHEIPIEEYQRNNTLPFQNQSKDHKYSEAMEKKHGSRTGVIRTWGRDKLARRMRRIHVVYTCMRSQ